jgi:cyanophycinase
MNPSASPPSGPMRFALLGAGEFEDWHDEIDRGLLDGSPDGDRVLILPTASAPEGDDVFDAWGSKGLEHYRRAGIDAEVLPMKTRADAERAELVDRLARASMVFFSGGNPAYLARVLDGSAFCRAMYERIREGMPYAGCSAGVACLTSTTFDSVVQELSNSIWAPGLGYMTAAMFAPHWDIVDDWIPGAREYIASSVPDGQALVGIDENTAMVGDGSAWVVHGISGVHVLRLGEWTHHAAGASFVLDLGIDGMGPTGVTVASR